MRASLRLSAFALALAPSVAAADAPDDDAIASSHLLHRLVERERSPLRMRASLDGARLAASERPAPAIPRPPYLHGAGSALDCVHATHDITLDPTTGVTSAILELRVRAAGAALASISFAVDAGLEPGTITATRRETSSAQAVFAPMRVIRVDLEPALAPGEETVVTMPYAGTLSCASAERGAVLCAKGADYSYFAHQSIFPYVFDTEAPDSFVFDGLTRDIVLRVPSDRDVVATGQKVSERVDGSTKVSRWAIDRPLSRVVGLYAFAGKLGLLPIAGRTAPTTFVFPSPKTAVDRDLVSWSTPALDFVERFSGSKLPFDRGLSLVRLPRTLGDPGTATFGMTLLSDSYAETGDLMYEETWAHENAHLFWGIVAPETDSNESRLMTEGMATLAELDYTFARRFASEDRDLYLARRFLPMGLDLRAQGADLPPAQLLPGTEVPTDFRTRRYTLWAYYRTALTLDHLRVSLGEEVFARALSAYVARCSFVGCRPDVFREIAGAESGRDLGPFFERWVTGKERPRVVVDFAPSDGGAEVELTKDDDRPMTLELWLTLADGARLKRRVDLGPRRSRVHLDAPAPVIAVRTSPRHDALVDARSAVDGDLDFDGETDGFDVLRCAPLVGQRYDAAGATGLWNVGETFDPRCDVNGDLAIDDEDLAAIGAEFGKLRPR
ncbi:MAG: hypothetical protein KF782_12830 [Labilithrix sp.]|nr:hypothetical protein [Labilithrix sp.]